MSIFPAPKEVGEGGDQDGFMEKLRGIKRIGYKASKIGLVRDVSILGYYCSSFPFAIASFSSAGESDYVLALGLLLCFSSKADGVVHWWLEKSSKI
ncbi:hypothetical protein KY289_007942 [Solanum tuberosum]|nr:hypothetical protein KY289_007942 [Solanum tuberosum]